MSELRDNASYVIGLYADAKGYARVRLAYPYVNGDSWAYLVEHVLHSNCVSIRAIQESLVLKSKHGSQQYYQHVYINSYPSLASMLWQSQNVEMLEINPRDRIFLTTCLFNDKRLAIAEQFRASLVDNLNNYDPNDGVVNHRVMALFLALTSCS